MQSYCCLKTEMVAITVRKIKKNAIYINIIFVLLTYLQDRKSVLVEEMW